MFQNVQTMVRGHHADGSAPGTAMFFWLGLPSLVDTPGELVDAALSVLLACSGDTGADSAEPGVAEA